MNDMSMTERTGRQNLESGLEIPDSTGVCSSRPTTTMKVEPTRCVSLLSDRNNVEYSLNGVQGTNKGLYETLSYTWGQPSEEDPEVRGNIFEGGAATSISTRDPPSTENMAELNSQYRINEGGKFKAGRIYKALWSETNGLDSCPGFLSNSKPSFSIIRRFMIVSPREGHRLCQPISSYQGQGMFKKRGRANHHTVIYTSDSSPGPSLLSKKKAQLRIRLHDLEDAGSKDRLSPQSRLNYAKLYTVEYDVKAHFIGDVEKGRHGEKYLGLTVKQYGDKDPDIAMWKRAWNCCDQVWRKDRAGLLHTEEDDMFIRQPLMMRGPPTRLGVANLGSALAMGGTYVWLNNTMGLEHHSEYMTWILDKPNKHLPALLETLPKPPDWAIFALFATSTLIFTGTIFLWGSNQTQRSVAKVFACLVATIGTVVFMLAGFQAEEIVLVGLPLSISMGILASCAFRIRAGGEEWNEKRYLVLGV